MGLAVAVERSRSGDGAHVWFFFTEPVMASMARRMGCYLITETMARRHELSLESCDRLFPNQDTLPRGGFGNLIALPLQHDARQRGNTVFVDERLVPFPDQWESIASIRPIDPGTVEAIAEQGPRRAEIIGLQIGQSPSTCEPSSADAMTATRVPRAMPASTVIVREPRQSRAAPATTVIPARREMRADRAAACRDGRASRTNPPARFAHAADRGFRGSAVRVSTHAGWRCERL